MSAFATRLKALMDERGLTRADLARQTAIPYHRINPWFVRENAKPNGQDIDKVARALNVSVSFLIDGEEDPRSSDREWILRTYDTLDPDRQKQLEGFLRFLAHSDSRGSEQD